MSTFDGIVDEFPSIRIDNFCVNSGNTRPLACFLSHVHSDHLKGLESLKAPFVYCSTATREILLRIEKASHRLNFDQGFLEAKVKQYKHLSKLLRPIPLETPTEIELSPIRRIRVTLFDANHCPGSVIFLFEDDDKSIIYTGDVRAEHWWVDKLIRHPVLLPYTMGEKYLRTLYLDTSFIRHNDIYQQYPSKAEGMRHLLKNVKHYPKDTVFYFRAWTLGYEEVWQALASALRSQIHVDRHKFELFASGASRPEGESHGSGWPESTFLCGFTLGHSHVEGCLTRNKSAQIHSCDPPCSRVSEGPTVYVTPVVSRTNILPSTSRKKKKIDKREDSLQNHLLMSDDEDSGMESQPEEVPQVIRFPYSRHSSYEELCDLVSTFNPENIVPCTVDLATWNEKRSIKALFGHLCSGKEYRHDRIMMKRLGVIAGDSVDKPAGLSFKLLHDTSPAHLNFQGSNSFQCPERNGGFTEPIQQIGEALHLEIRSPCASSPNPPASPGRSRTGRVQVPDSMRSCNSHGSHGIADIRELLMQQEAQNQLQFSITPAKSPRPTPAKSLHASTSNNQTHNNTQDGGITHAIDSSKDSSESDDISDRSASISLTSDITPSSENPELCVSGTTQEVAKADVKTRFQAYRAVQSGSFHMWSSLYGQSIYHGEEIEL